MGGRGSNSGISRGSLVTSVIGRDGKAIDLSDSPLQYGGKDQSLTFGEKLRVLPFEGKYVNADTEHVLLVGKSGNIVYTDIGEYSYVRLPKSVFEGANVLTHNHPRTGSEKGYLGGTFSDGDLKAFVGTNISTMRAAAHEGTYTITKGKNFDGKGFKKYATQMYTRIFNKYLKKTEFLAAEDRSKEFNKAAVDLHNVYLKAAKKYGYTYTLEKRRD